MKAKFILLFLSALLAVSTLTLSTSASAWWCGWGRCHHTYYGYSDCRWVEGHYVGGVWVQGHRVCR